MNNKKTANFRDNKFTEELGQEAVAIVDKRVREGLPIQWVQIELVQQLQEK